MVQRTSFETRYVDDALEVLESYFPKVRISQPRDDFSLSLQHSDAGVFSVIDYRLVCERSCSAATMDGAVAIGQVTRGTFALANGRNAINTSAPWLFPTTEVIAHWDDVALKVLSLPSADVARFASRMSGRELSEVKFSSTSPRTRVLGEQWTTLTTYITHALSPAGSLARSPIAKANAFAHIASVLLATFPNASFDDSGEPSSNLANRSVRRALAYIDDNAHRPITVEDVAEAAGVSLRVLQYAFRSTLGSTPNQRLRRVRLARAHEDLLVADPSRGDTVTRIAHAWGFMHVGRFAQEYRANYGATPMERLRAN